MLILFIAVTSSWAGAFVASSCSDQCASVCKCKVTENGCEVRCIGQNLRKIPSPLPKLATLLDLSDNIMTSLPAMGFSKLKKLRILRIDNNRLQRLHPDCFRGLTYLQELSLENNELELVITTFAPYLFTDLVRLKRLKLRMNKQFYGDYLDKSVPKLRSLESLYIVGFSGKIFGHLYRRLKYLNYVSFSSVNKPSLMEVIPEQAFQNLPYLKYLNLSYCRVKDIHKNTFSYLPSLTVLDLSYNRNMTFLGLRQALYGLRNISTLQFLNISAIHEIFGLGTEFKIEDVENLKTTSLKSLHLDSNKLEFFQAGALTMLPSTLQYLSLRDNRLTLGWYVIEIYHLPNIRVIDFSFKLNHYNLLNIYYSKNSISNDINLYNNSKMSLEVILFSDCYIKYPLPYFNPRFSSVVRYINASGNMFCPWQGPIKGLEKMILLDLSNNMCRTVSNIFFSFFASLRTLYINDNLLGISKNMDGFNVVFQNLTKLESLTLSNNRIANISKFSLINQVNMSYLDLSDNLLQTFSIRIGNMRNLGMLDLSNNFLESLSAETYKEIENISLTQNITVNLMRNKLKCSCYYMNFLKWMLMTKQSKKINLIYEKCIFANGTSTSLKGDYLERVVQHLDKSCSSILSLILPASILMFVLIICLVGGFIYRYRWNLRYFYYMMKARYSFQNEKAENFVFDAFVSYSEDEGEFVINKMIPELEEHGNLHLNIHHRDFVPGRKIVENILSAIQQSRYCLVLLSSGFLKSQWCMYEFSMAKMETVYAERDMVVVIMLEEVDTESIPLELMHHLKTKSYIEYPTRDEQGQQLFWNNMRDLLQGKAERI